MSKQIISLSALLLFLTVPGSQANIVALRSTAALTNTSDAIVIATAQGGTQTDLGASFVLQVQRVVAGPSALANSSVPVNWNSALENSTTPGMTFKPAGGGSGIWFLKLAASGWEVIPVVDGKIPFEMAYYSTSSQPLPARYLYSPSDSASNRVAAELCAAVEFARGVYNFQLSEMLEGDLDKLGAPVLQVLYARLATSPVPREEAVGLSGLIRAQDIGALATAAAFAKQSVSLPQETGMVRFAVAQSFRAYSDAAVSALGTVVVDASGDQAFRQAAAHALARIHTASSLSSLAKLLDDTDPLLRAEGIAGISSFANGLIGQSGSDVSALAWLQLPASAPFRTPDTIAHFAANAETIQNKESYYLVFWKTWWQEHMAQLGG